MSLPPNQLPEADQNSGSQNLEIPTANESALGIAEQHIDRFPPWSGWDVVAVLVVTLIAVFAFSVIALAIARRLPAYRQVPIADLATYAKIVVGAQSAAYPVVLLFMLAVVRTRSRQQFAQAIHWNWPGLSAAGFLVMGVVLAFVTESLSRYLPIPKSLPMDKYFSDPASAYLMAVFGITLAPLLEELFFRGMLYPLLRRAFGIMTAVLVTAAAFASIHGTQLGYAWGPIVSIFFVGIVFTLTRLRTNSVAASFLMHVGYNFTLFGLLWIASDHYRHLEKVAG
jgi:membrane protease YdiL (CAAX protease family)